MRAQTLNQYIHTLVELPRVQDFLNQYDSQQTFKCPPVVVVPSCGSLVAALTYSNRLIEVSSWILVDDSETYGVLRHEFAHVIKAHCKLPGTPHGRGYIHSLKNVSPKTWQNDKYWHPTVDIEEARLKIHSKSKTIIDRER